MVATPFIAHILVVNKSAVVLCHRDRLGDFANELLGRFIHAHYRKVRVIGALIHIQNVLHGCNKPSILIGGYFPVFAQMRAQLVFFRERWIVIVETESTISSSTAF